MFYKGFKCSILASCKNNSCKNKFRVATCNTEFVAQQVAKAGSNTYIIAPSLATQQCCDTSSKHFLLVLLHFYRQSDGYA